MKHLGSRKSRISLQSLLLLLLSLSVFCLLLIALRSLDPVLELELRDDKIEGFQKVDEDLPVGLRPESPAQTNRGPACATVEKMGEVLAEGSEKESLRVRRIIQHHFKLNGATTVRMLPPDQFCRHGFVMGKSSEAGFGNEMYKVLTAAALSVLLNRSLIIGQTRGKFPFEGYISYTDLSFTLKEVKHLWRQNDCVGRYRRHLTMRTDDFEKPTETNVLCSDWRKWKQPIIWFQGTTDAIAIQFFLKSIHPQMRDAATNLFGHPGVLQSRPNVFGELMRVVISPSQPVEEAVNWVLNGGGDPDVTLHMRMLTNRSVRALQAALNCIKKVLHGYNQNQVARPRVALVSDTPSFIEDITPRLREFAEVLHFDYKKFKGNISSGHTIGAELKPLDFRVKDWGPAPRWVAFVDFFLASRTKYAVVSGAHRRVGTTYAQLVAALAAAHHLGENSSITPHFSFWSSFHSNLLRDGLANQIGWGHAWNRFAGPLSCRKQRNQCACTPLLPSAWWDATWQSPIPRDVRRLQAYGVILTDSSQVIESRLHSFCNSKKEAVKTVPVIQQSH